MIRHFLASLLALVLLAALVAAALPAIGAAVGGDDNERESGSGTVSCDGCRPSTAEDLNLRTAPDLSSEVLTVIPAGTELALAGAAKDGYVPVVHDGELGWVFAAYVAPPGVTAAAGADLAATTASLNLRAGPAPSAEVVAVIPAGALVVLLDEERDGYTRVAFDGLSGYASARYLSES